MRDGSLSPSAAFRSSSPVTDDGTVDLSGLPPVNIISAHIEDHELHQLEDNLINHHAPLTYDTREAKLFLCNIHTKKRIQFELRKSRIWTEEKARWASNSISSGHKRASIEPEESSKKRRRLNSSTTSVSPSVSELEEYDKQADSHKEEGGISEFQRLISTSSPNWILVVKIQWLKDTIAQGKVISLLPYIVYEGEKVDKPLSDDDKLPIRNDSLQAANDQTDDILKRALADPPSTARGPNTRFLSAPHGSRRFRDQAHRRHEAHEKPELMQLDTVSSQEQSQPSKEDLPPPPDWVIQNLKYSCQRSTPSPSPNEEFLDLLKNIRLARLLTLDEIGVRAYSTAIASIAAVPTRVISPLEITRLPGCDVKFANLWVEYAKTGGIKAAEEVDTDETLKILNTFYQVWGIGATTAKAWFDRGWRDLDDVIEYGWNDLTRAQKIGVKFNEEFQKGIPRTECEAILAKVREHAVKVRDEGIQALMVGGYRRGKELSGDVDIILSHRDLRKTKNLITDIVKSLEDEGWITHTLRVDLTSTNRGQSTIPLKARSKAQEVGQGFDTLDKAMVVWQDISWPTRDTDLQEDESAKNPNIHRRVDIIISAWRTVGCAVLGWSGGTTFQRDIRRYVKYVKEWKFDSSGIRNRRTGELVRAEGPNGVSGDMVEAEKSVFEELGLVYREPWERCTG
jgi:DNA polymerase IV